MVKSWDVQNIAWGLAVSLVWDMAPKEALFLLSLNESFSLREK